ncbi:MAG TPA: hypothetical protein DCZ80_04260, partial [Legionellales bacterium]|nr:hypothetical protein [Legionellales bacterium]
LNNYLIFGQYLALFRLNDRSPAPLNYFLKHIFLIPSILRADIEPERILKPRLVMLQPKMYI